MFLHKAMRYYRLWIYSCNLVLLVSVMVFVALASWALADYHMALFPSVRFHQPTFVYAYAALVLQGGILQAIGCVGALKMNEKMLNSYWSLMLALLVGDLVVGVVWIFRYQNLTSGLGGELRSRLREDYGNDQRYQVLWDKVQRESRCCGVYGPSDYVNSTWMTRAQADGSKQAVPRSCCMAVWDPRQREYVPPNVTACVTDANDETLVHQNGCLEPVHRWLQRNADILAVIGFCVIAFLKICFLAILRYEIREMIQKIKILKGLDDQSMVNAGMIPGFDQTYIPKSQPGGGTNVFGDNPGALNHRNHPPPPPPPPPQPQPPTPVQTPNPEPPTKSSGLNHHQRVYNNNLPEDGKDCLLSKSANGNNNDTPLAPSREISAERDNYGSNSPV